MNQESYFFRESGQLELLRRTVLPERVAARGSDGTLHLWSAGCARGQEPYTLAILLEEAGLGGRSHVLATDLSGQALEAARLGVYGKWSLRALDDRRLRTYFRPVPGGFRIHPRLARPVTFRRHDLLGQTEARVSDMDVVLCRNVLVYFTPAMVEQVGRRLVKALAPGGWLLTASTDPRLETVEGIETIVTPAGIAYRRHGASQTAVRAEPPRPAVRQAVRQAARQAARQAGAHGPRAAPPSPPVLPRPRSGEPDAEAAAVFVRALGSGGDLAAAARAAGEAVARFPLHLELRLLQAMVLLESGMPDEAVKAARAAVYVDPGAAMAHLTLGRAEQASGNTPAAQRSYRNALVLLEAMPTDEPVALADGASAGRLADLARAARGLPRQSASAP